MKTRRYLSAIMIFALLVQLCMVGACAEISLDSDIAGDQYQNLEEAETDLGLSFHAPISFNEEKTSLKELLDQMEPTDVIQHDSHTTISYPTSIVEAYLPQNVNIIEITVMGDGCYITYGITGIPNRTLVYLHYSLAYDRVMDITVRDMDADTRVTFSDGEKRVEESLTKGNKNTYQGLHMDSRYFFAAQVFAVLFSLRALYLCIVACANINSRDVSTGEKRRKRFFISQALLYFCEFLILPIIYILNFHIIIWGILVFLISLLQVIMLKYHKS